MNMKAMMEHMEEVENEMAEAEARKFNKKSSSKFEQQLYYVRNEFKGIFEDVMDGDKPLRQNKQRYDSPDLCNIYGTCVCVQEFCEKSKKRRIWKSLA